VKTVVDEMDDDRKVTRLKRRKATARLGRKEAISYDLVMIFCVVWVAVERVVNV